MQAELKIPFAHLNLRFNPFGELPLEHRASLAVPQIDVAPIVERLRRPGYAMQFLGDKGRGKTTHLLALRAYFPEATYIHIGEDDPVPAIPEEPLIFLDEMQRVPRRVRKQLFRRATSWVIGTHVDHSPEMKKAGLEFESHRFNGLDPSLLVTLLNRRVYGAIRDPDLPVPAIGENVARRLIELYYDDIRAMEGHLYNVFQNMSEVQDVEV